MVDISGFTKHVDPVASFRRAMAASGIVFDGDIYADGNLHRIHVNDDKTGTKNGWYVLYNDGIPAGSYGNWKDGAKRFKWCAKSENTLTTVERTAFREAMAKAKRQREQMRAEEQEAARRLAEETWNNAQAITSHPYLVAKGVRAYDLRQDVKGNLIIPMRDNSGNIHSLQTIGSAPPFQKLFLKDGAKAGHYFIIQGDNNIFVAEGYATAASIHEAIGGTVIVAFDTSNLLPVAKAIRASNPNAEITFCADNDQWTKEPIDNPGVTKAKEAAQAIRAKVAIPQFKDLSSRPTDFNDLHQQEGIDTVRAQIDAAATEPNKPLYRVVDAGELMQLEFPPRKNLLSPWLPEQGLCMVYAHRGVGKTYFGLGAAVAVASGGSFLGWAAEEPVGVLYIDGEMPAVTMQERIAAAINASDKDVVAPLRILTPDLQENGMPDIATCEGQQAINEHITDEIKLIVTDNLSTLVRSGRENEAESWLPVQQWALSLRARGKSVLFVHHSNKSGGQRGSIRKEDTLDTVIKLERPANYHPEDGACFEIHFEKSRGIFGDDVKPFEAKYISMDGPAKWATRSIEDSTYEKVVKLAKEGLEQKEIAEEMGIHKSSVSRHIKKAKDNGDLP